jgi:hypothetical protein
MEWTKVRRGERTFSFICKCRQQNNNTTKTNVKLRKATHAQTKTMTHNYQKGKRLPKYDSQSETTIDSCPWLRAIPGQNIETNNIECPPQITPWPNQIEKWHRSLRSGCDRHIDFFEANCVSFVYNAFYYTYSRDVHLSLSRQFNTYLQCL